MSVQLGKRRFLKGLIPEEEWNSASPQTWEEIERLIQEKRASVNSGAQTENTDFLQKIATLLIEKSFKEGSDPAQSKVVDFLLPEELQKAFNFNIEKRGESDEKLIEICHDVIKYSVKTSHPFFLNQLYQGQDQYGLAGSWLTEAINTSQFTYEVSPVFSVMESYVLKQMMSFIGFTKGDGIFCPGGSISNFYGMNLARFYKFPEVKEEGMHGIPKLVMFTSENAHYSVVKGAAFLGLGVRNCRKVKTDKRGKMDPEDLKAQILECIEHGYTPFMVLATCGTTVVGAYDPINPLADLCEQYGMWLHVDCCWGGCVLLSRKHKHKMAGVERADSVAWNPHKMMSAPLQCCAFMTKHEDLLKLCYSACAAYLFQPDKFYDVSYDTGDKSIQCSRKPDIFKLWLMWKRRGEMGFEQEIDSLLDRAQYFVDKIRNRPGFRLLFDEIECTNVCFWYIPESMRDQEETLEWWDRLHKLAPRMKERMVRDGSMLVGYQPMQSACGDYVNFWRLVIGNFRHTNEHMDAIIAEFERVGELSGL